MAGYVLKSEVMCLSKVTTDEPQIAKRNITVYKVLIKRKGRYLTLWRECPVQIGKTYTSKLVKRMINDHFDSSNWGIGIEEGLHSYRYYKAIKDSCCIKVKCIIPKGSQYYVGTFCEYVSIASDKLTYVKIIE
jgi:hypothetical protein